MKNFQPSPLCVLVLTALSAGTVLADPLGSPLSGQSAPELLVGVRGAVFASSAAVRSHRVVVRTRLLEAGASKLRLDLPGGIAREFRLVELERRGVGDLTWRGTLSGTAVEATLTLKNGYVVGLINDDEDVYWVSTQPDGGQRLERIEQSRFPSCGTEQLGSSYRSGSSAGLPVGDSPPCPNPTDDVDRLDLLAYYTTLARDEAGGVGQIEAVIQAAVDVTNTAFLNSLMDLRFVLVHTELSERVESAPISDVFWLHDDPGVAATRDVVDADLVSLMVSSAANSCGIGFLPHFWPGPPAAKADDSRLGGGPTRLEAFQVTRIDCAVGNLTFAHEHGHNLGFEHNPEDAGTPPQGGTYPFRYGHYVDQVFRTVMSYDDQCSQKNCPRQPYFSNPLVDFKGNPTGVPDVRDNSRVGALTKTCVTDYEIAGEVFIDGFESGDTSAWSVTVP